MSFKTISINVTSDQQLVILQAQTYLKLAVSSLKLKVGDLILSTSNIKVSILTSFQNTLQTVTNTLTSILGNSRVNASILTPEETNIMMQVILNFTNIFETLGKN